MKLTDSLNRPVLPGARVNTSVSAYTARLLAGVVAVGVAAGAAAAETDAGWPRVMTTTNDNRVEIFQPQLASWQDNHLQARAVVEVTVSGDPNPHLGVAWFKADTSVDKTQGLATLQNVTVTRVQFSEMAQEEANMLMVMSNALPLVTRTVALDRLVMASVVAQHQARRGAVSLKHDPPLVIWTTNAVAALVLIDGEPVLRPVTNSALLRVINTAALILFDPTGGTYYLAGDGGWFQAGAIAGPWAAAPNPPAAVSQLSPPSNQASKSSDPAAQSPVVFVSTKPAELLQTTGAPSYKYEEGSGLMYLANSDSQVLYDPEGATAYLLISGRWFASKPGLTGPWTYVPSKQLPPSFAQIAPSGPKGVVLASVAGTSQAAAAHAANSVPQTATIQRAGASFEVQYDGPPQFQPLAGTSLQYAVNAAAAVVLCQNTYYAVGNAVWFTSALPTGPWAVASSVPETIYSIPPSSPLYYVTFVYIGYANTNEVETAYLPGYVGSYDDEDDIAPAYGTGWYYPPWVGDNYYGWGWPYGYDFQYRWWERSWLWRPAWNRVGNLYAVNQGSVYERWPRAAADRGYVARATFDRAAGFGYPTEYGRFAGATRAVPMALPARASLVDPYARVPAAQAMPAARVGSAEARDLYATPEGTIYRRQEGKWYRADTAGHWAYVSPAAGPVTHPYHPATVANYEHPAAYGAAATPRADARPPEARSLDQDYYGRAQGERNYQSRPAYRGRR